MFHKYESKKQIVTLQCPVCDKYRDIEVKDLKYYSTSQEGLFIVGTKCPHCPSYPILHTGRGFGNNAGHALNSLASSVLLHGQMLEDETVGCTVEQCRKKVDALGECYVEKLHPLKDQFLGLKDIVWKSNKYKLYESAHNA